MEQTKWEKVRDNLKKINDILGSAIDEVDRLKGVRDLMVKEYLTSSEEESKKEKVCDPKTYAGALLRDTWNILDNLHMIGFSNSMIIRGDIQHRGEQRVERKPVKIDEYNTLRKKVVQLGIIK